MSDLERLTPEQEQARDAVRALPPLAARPAYRARLREGFVTGTLDTPARVVPLRSRTRPVWIGVTAAAAAAVVLAFALNRGPRWEVMGTSGAGAIEVDGRAVPANDAGAVTAALHPGARVRMTGDAELVIQSGHSVAIDVMPGSEVTLPAPPPRWIARATAGELRTGELRITTGPGFHGARLAIATPEAGIEVTGTTLAVIREPQGTCVCVLEGTVRMGGHREAMVPVPHGHLRYVFGDGHAKMDDMRPVERVQLTLFRAARARGMAE